MNFITVKYKRLGDFLYAITGDKNEISSPLMKYTKIEIGFSEGLGEITFYSTVPNFNNSGIPAVLRITLKKEEELMKTLRDYGFSLVECVIEA